MGMDVASSTDPVSTFEQLRQAREIIRAEGRSLLELAERLDYSFCRAVELLYACQGSVIVSGMGKAGLVGQKIAATLASTGTRSHSLHPAEAVHGDLGRICRDDVLLILSQSGDTDEVLCMLPALSRIQVPLIAVTSRPESRLGRAADIVLDLGPLQEAGALGLAPTTSTTAMLALGDALALVTSQMRCFGVEDFAKFHPAGSLGRRLAKVEQLMRPLPDCRVADHGKTVRQVLIDAGRPGRRSGAILLIDQNNLLCGIFTDSDLSRLLEDQQDNALDATISRVMTTNPKTVTVGTRLTEAVEILVTEKISELPVIDEQRKPLGIIDITDVLGTVPQLPSHFSSLESANTTRPSLAPFSPIHFPNQK